MKLCCVFSLELPHGGDSNEYTQYTSFSIKKYHPKFAAMGFFYWIQECVLNSHVK